MSMRPQAHDIIRTWAFYSIIKAYYHQNDIPWKEIVISGHVLSGKNKISKSKGKSNVPSPEKLLETYPADVIRYWTANGKLGTDTAFSENQLKIGQRLITKLWNAFRFCKDHLSSYEKIDPSTVELDSLSKWLLQNFSNTVKSYHKYFGVYNYTQALEVAEKFFWHNFCDNYLELIKDQIFNPENYDEQTLNATRFVLYEVGFGILQLFAPFLPHITENLYQSFYSSIHTSSLKASPSTRDEQSTKSIHSLVFDKSRFDKSRFDKSQFNYDFEKEAELFNKIIELVSIVRKLKTKNQLSLKVEIETLNIYSKDKVLLEVIKKEDALIKGITKTKEIVFKESSLKESSLNKVDDKLFLDIFV